MGWVCEGVWGHADAASTSSTTASLLASMAKPPSVQPAYLGHGLIQAGHQRALLQGGGQRAASGGRTVVLGRGLPQGAHGRRPALVGAQTQPTP